VWWKRDRSTPAEHDAIASSLASESNDAKPILRAKDTSPGPNRASYEDREFDLADASAVLDRINALSAMRVGDPTERHNPFSGKTEPDISVLDRMTRLMKHLHNWRYTGPLLTQTELAEIHRASSQGRSRALAEDRMIRRFIADRPLPDDFANGPLRWQVDTLVWSFHSEPDAKLTITEAVDALADALKLDEPIQPNPLEMKYPALTQYAGFLKRLPLR
jgi:hypothetical protein